jgi:glycosyltransferase involved in cell wall biosynthesis
VDYRLSTVDYHYLNLSTMRICFLSRRYFPAVSGMSVYARNMTRALAERGHEIVMISQYREDERGVGIYGGGPPPDEPWMQVQGLRSFGEERAAPQTPADFEGDTQAMIAEALRHHRQKSFDVVHAQYCYPTGLAALEISRQLNLPSVISIQGGDGHWVGLCCTTHRDAMQAVLNHATALVIGCRSFADEVAHNHGIPMKRLTIVPGATNVEQFKPAQPIGALRDPARLLYHGRVDQRKGVLDFVRAGRQLLDAGAAVRFIISGIGPDAEAARRLVSELKMEDQTDFLGAVPYAEAARVYGQGDLFISPTYAEGFSNTILEAMASGLPIVSTRTVGVVDCLEDGVNAALVEPGDVDALTQAIRRMLHDEAYRVGLARQAYEEVLRQYSWPVVAQQLEKIYQQVRRTKVDHGWQETFDIETTVAEADLSCRFRQDPHLL